MKLFPILLTSAFLAFGQNVDWPTYNGDFSGQRFNSLAQIDTKNIAGLSPTWTYHVNVSHLRGLGAVQIKSTPLEVNGILYFTIPDHVWALDARTGVELWHFAWEDKGGHLTGQRGVGIFENWVYFLTPDGWLFCLDAGTGKERWRKQVADPKLQYFTTMAPLVIRNHVIVGVGGDAMDVPGYLESRDPETGDLQWRWNSEPAAGEPGADTWPDDASREHGGGMTWLTGTYDPGLNLLYWGTGNPNPVYAAQGRKGTNLYTCSIVALDADTGKLAWYFSASPHDTHDWDNVETPVLFDGVVNGKPRKLLAQAARNGYFFVLDRTNGKNIVSEPFGGANWSKGTDANGSPIPNEDKEPKTDGAILNTVPLGATNWWPPAFDPHTGLFYVNFIRGYGLAYLTDTDPHPEGYGGEGRLITEHGAVAALDYRTGKTAWSHDYPGHGHPLSGLLATAGGLLFSGDSSWNFIARDAKTGKPLWHYRMNATPSNGPMTYKLGNKQYIVAAAGDALYGFTLSDAK